MGINVFLKEKYAFEIEVNLFLIYISLNVAQKFALRNPFSVHCNNFVEITDQCVQVNINECHSLIV